MSYHVLSVSPTGRKQAVVTLLGIVALLGIAVRAGYCQGTDAVKVQKPAVPKEEVINFGYTPPLDLEERRKKSTEVAKIIKEGDALLSEGKPDEAIALYKQTFLVDPRDGRANLNLAKAYAAKGDDQKAIEAYRTLLYPFPGKDWGYMVDINASMNFAILLSKNGLRDEAIRVYNNALNHINYVDDKPRSSDKDFAPLTITFDGRDRENVYTPTHFEAVARTAMASIALMEWHMVDAKEPLKQALALEPRLAIAHLYEGVRLRRLHAPQEQINTELDKAAQLSSLSSIKAAVEEARRPH